MDALGQLLETWGYALLVLVGFVEFIGLPLKIPNCDGAPARVVAVEER